MNIRQHFGSDAAVKGRIHSLDTFGTVDGPGIRFVLFMQGCALRCQFCHNPDSWDTAAGDLTTVEEVLAEIEPFVSYYKRSGGGITVTGGEPTLQAPFVAALFREVKRRFGLHTALDTSGFCEPSHFDSSGLLEATDLVLLDLKQINKDRHVALTTQSNKRTIRFACHLSDEGKSMWIRHVLVPGVTDSYQDLLELGQFIGTLDHVQKLELLPYHRMGIYKWQQLKLPYPLEGISAPTEDQIERAYRLIDTGRQEASAYKR